MTSISDETNIEKIEHKSKKNFALGTIFGYLAILAGVAYGIFMTPEIVRSVGEHEYGLYGLSTSIINVFLMDFGLSMAINTYLVKLRAKGDKAGVQKFLAAIFKLYLILDIFFIVFVAGLTALSPYIFSKNYSDTSQTLQYLFVIVGGYTIISLPCSCFTGVISTYEKFSFLKFLDFFQKIAYLLLSILSVTFHWEINGSGIIPIVLINVTCALGAILSRYLFMRFYLNIRLDLRLKITKEERKGVLSFSAWGFVLAVCTRLAFNITPFIVSIMSDDNAVTIFTLVTTLELYIFTFGEVFISFSLAKIARTEVDGTEEEKTARLQALSEKLGKIQLVVIGLIYLGFLAVGQEFIQFWMRNQTDPHKYLIVYWCIMALSAYEIFRMPAAVFNNAMYTHNKVKILAIISIVKAVVNLSLSFLLSYLFTYIQIGELTYGIGALGASFAIMIARVTDLTLQYFAYRKYLHVSISHFFKAVYSRSMITMMISLGVGLALHYLNPLSHNTLKLLINGFAFVIVYFICTIFITFTKKERRYYINVLFELLHIKKRLPVEEDEKIEEKKVEEIETEKVEEIEEK